MRSARRRGNDAVARSRVFLVGGSHQVLAVSLESLSSSEDWSIHLRRCRWASNLLATSAPPTCFMKSSSTGRTSIRWPSESMIGWSSLDRISAARPDALVTMVTSLRSLLTRVVMRAGRYFGMMFSLGTTLPSMIRSAEPGLMLR